MLMPSSLVITQHGTQCDNHKSRTLINIELTTANHTSPSRAKRWGVCSEYFGEKWPSYDRTVWTDIVNRGYLWFTKPRLNNKDTGVSFTNMDQLQFYYGKVIITSIINYQLSARWNHLFISKFYLYSRWSLRKDKAFYPTLNTEHVIAYPCCDYIKSIFIEWAPVECPVPAANLAVGFRWIRLLNVGCWLWSQSWNMRLIWETGVTGSLCYLRMVFQCIQRPTTWVKWTLDRWNRWG